MTRLGFLSPSNAAPGVAVVSPHRGTRSATASPTSRISASSSCAAALDGVETGPGEELLRLAPRRGLLVTEGSPAVAIERLRAQGVRAYDVTAALAAFEFEGDDALRRLTELDPASFPTAGSLARGTRAVLDARGERSLPRLRRAGARPPPRRGRPRHAEGARPVKDLFRVRRMWRPAASSSAATTSSSSAAARTASRPPTTWREPRHPRRRRARAVVHRLGRGGPQHDDHPLQLPHPRGRRVLRAQRRALRGPRGRARLQPDVLPARPPDARPLRPRDARDARARRGEPAARDRLASRRPGRDREALPAARPRPAPDVADPWARSTTRPAGSSATTPSSGASRAAPTAAAPRSTRTPR